MEFGLSVVSFAPSTTVSISCAHAAPGEESRHNLVYWRYGDFVGIGPGAHGRYVDPDGQRRASAAHKAPDAWLRHVMRDGHGVQTLSVIDNRTAQREALMMGLRLSKGIDRAAWREKFGNDPTDFVPAERLARLTDEGYLSLNANSLTATPEGAIRLNRVISWLSE